MSTITVRRYVRSSFSLAGAFLLFLMLWGPADSQAETTFCTLGSGAGQCDQPQRISADPVTGEAYVADAGNNRVDVFSSAGEFLFAFGWGVKDGSSTLQKCTTATGCQKGIADSGAGQFDHPRSVAVDHTAGRVYVTDSGSFRIQEFDLEGGFVLQFGKQGSGECEFENTARPIAVGPSGSVYVGEGSAVQKFSEAGACLGETTLASSGVTSLAVDSAGDLYAPAEPEPGEKGVGKFGPSGSLLCFDPPLHAEDGAVAVDASGNTFVGQRLSAVFRPYEYTAITEYSASCEPLRRFSYEDLYSGAPISGLAAYSSASGDLFVSEVFGGESGGSRVRYVSFPPAGPIVPAGGVEAPAESVSNTKALVRAEINPEGKATEYHFEYLTQQEWESQGESFEGPATRESAAGEITATDFELHGVEGLIGCQDPVNDPPSTCLAPETTYRYRVVATNADGSGEGTREGEPFTTKAALEITSTFATEVSSDTAHLGAEVIPLGIPTTGYFEYVTDASYQETGFTNALQAPDVAGGAAELDFGSSEEAVLRSVALPGLLPGTTYHYRISVSDSVLGTNRVLGPERTFRTFALPATKSCPSNEVFRTGPSALVGDCRAYELVSPLEKGSGDVIPPTEVVSGHPAALDQSAMSGSKLAYGSYRAFGDAEAGPYSSQYVAERGSEGWQSHTITPPRGRALTEVGLQADTEVRVLSPDLCEAWLTTVAEPPLTPDAVSGDRNIYRRHDDGACGEQGYEAVTTLPPAHPENVKFRTMELQGLSADGSIAIYTVNDNLEGTSAPDNPEEKQQLYKRTSASTKFVCILPNGKPTTGACSAGTNFGFIVSGQSRAASLDNAISPDGQRVFWTAYGGSSKGPGQIYLRIGNSKTVPVSKVGEEGSGTTTSVFLKANEESTRALFLTGEDLYEFDLASENTTLIAHQVPGILGASEDLSRIYLVSKEALAGENADHEAPVVGKPNLYLTEEGQFSFIATLVPYDVRPLPSVELGGTSATSFAPFTRNSRLSADGSQAVFMSSGRPTGYDNTDAGSGNADAEVYRYDVAGEKLLCLSCNPTNARPMGSDIVRGVFDFWAGGSISGWENDLYASRNLAEGGGRVFFESSDALSVRDSNGVGDVYEWEEPGAGSCSQASSSYSPANGGCLQLISSGQSARRSEFNDASPNGDDVFFSTLDSLVPQDYGLVDVYDARVGGGLPSPPAPPAECEGEACQAAPPAPEAQTPSSLGYEGPGNETKHPKPKCAKKKVRKSGHCVKRHKHHKKKGRKKHAKHGGSGR